jgi:hypothetical protein
MEMLDFTEEMIEKLKSANKRLLIDDNSNKERQQNIVFVYCPPKVGSTSLVSSIRLFANDKYNVIHLHNESILKILYNIDVSIIDLIKYNGILGKNIYVFDVYRHPIEHKISVFFEKLEKFHFNSSVDIIEKFPIEKIIARFNNLFPYLGGNDYYRNEYGIEFPESFDFDKKFSMVTNKNIKYIKLRLFDSSNYWSSILHEILGIRVKILRDYETKEKPIKEVYKKFMESYKIPYNFLENIKNDSSFLYYTNEQEKNSYLVGWEKKLAAEVSFYSFKEYDFYLTISSENQSTTEIHADHYIDTGCICKTCNKKRSYFREEYVKKNIQPPHIKHENVKLNAENKYGFERQKSIQGGISFNMLKGL